MGLFALYSHLRWPVWESSDRTFLLDVATYAESPAIVEAEMDCLSSCKEKFCRSAGNVECCERGGNGCEGGLLVF